MPTNLRKATLADLDIIVRERLAFLAEVRGPDYEVPPGFAAETQSFTQAETAGGRLHTWIADVDDEVAGIVSLLLWFRPPKPEDRRTAEAYIINMYVHAQHQRQGVGRRLLQAALDSGGELGIRKFLLHATDEGQALYESAGFAPKSGWMELDQPS